MPLAARAQPQPMPVIGMLTSTSVSSERRAAFDRGLRETGFFDGQNVAIDYKAAQGQADRMQAMLAAMIRRPVALIVANSIAARAAKDATTTIPIVFTVGSDPVADGLVTSLNRPGGNVTGASFLAGRLGTKRLDLLRQYVSGLAPRRYQSHLWGSMTRLFSCPQPSSCVLCFGRQCVTSVLPFHFC